MVKIYISEALKMVTDFVDKDDFVTANKMLDIISKEITKQKRMKINSREIELKTQHDRKYFEKILREID